MVTEYDRAPPQNHNASGIIHPDGSAEGAFMGLGKETTSVVFPIHFDRVPTLKIDDGVDVISITQSHFKCTAPFGRLFNYRAK